MPCDRATNQGDIQRLQRLADATLDRARVHSGAPVAVNQPSTILCIRYGGLRGDTQASTRTVTFVATEREVQMSMLAGGSASANDDAAVLRALGDAALAAGDVGPFDARLARVFTTADPVITSEALVTSLSRFAARRWLEPLSAADAARAS